MEVISLSRHSTGGSLVSDLFVYAVFGLSVVVAAQILFNRDLGSTPKKPKPKQELKDVREEQSRNEGAPGVGVSVSFDDPLWRSLDQRLAERKLRFPYKG